MRWNYTNSYTLLYLFYVVCKMSTCSSFTIIIRPQLGTHTRVRVRVCVQCSFYPPCRSSRVENENTVSDYQSRYGLPGTHSTNPGTVYLAASIHAGTIHTGRRKSSNTVDFICVTSSTASLVQQLSSLPSHPQCPHCVQRPHCAQCPHKFSGCPHCLHCSQCCPH